MNCKKCKNFYSNREKYMNPIREEIQESTDEKALHVINNMLGLNNVSLSDIARTHRIGKKVARQTRNSPVRPLI